MTIKSFDNLEDFFAAETTARNEADAGVEPFQAKLKPGDFFVRVYAHADVVIYGEILVPGSDEELTEDGLSEEDLAEIKAEYEAEAALRNQPQMRHYHFSRCFSQMCQEGEVGDVHASTIAAVIPRSSFEEARKLGWPSTMAFVKRIANLN